VASYADEDLRLARHGLTLRTGCPHRLIAYHAQQCAEKSLKAYLVFHNVDFPFTHNLARLRELCGEIAEWPESVQGVDTLTPFAITARYPGEDEAVTRREAVSAIELAVQVRKKVRQALREAGLRIR